MGRGDEEHLPAVSNNRGNETTANQECSSQTLSEKMLHTHTRPHSDHLQFNMASIVPMIHVPDDLNLIQRLYWLGSALGRMVNSSTHKPGKTVIFLRARQPHHDLGSKSRAHSNLHNWLSIGAEDPTIWWRNRGPDQEFQGKIALILIQAMASWTRYHVGVS